MKLSPEEAYGAFDIELQPPSTSEMVDLGIVAHSSISEIVNGLSIDNTNLELLGMARMAERLTDHLAVMIQTYLKDNDPTDTP